MDMVPLLFIEKRKEKVPLLVPSMSQSFISLTFVVYFLSGTGKIMGKQLQVDHFYPLSTLPYDQLNHFRTSHYCY